MPARSSIPSECGAQGETSGGEDRSTHEQGGPERGYSCVVYYPIVTGPWDPDKRATPRRRPALIRRRSFELPVAVTRPRSWPRRPGRPAPRGDRGRPVHGVRVAALAGHAEPVMTLRPQGQEEGRRRRKVIRRWRARVLVVGPEERVDHVALDHGRGSGDPFEKHQVTAQLLLVVRHPKQVYRSLPRVVPAPTGRRPG